MLRYNHLATFFSGDDDPNNAQEDTNRRDDSKSHFTQLFINLPNLELEYSPTLVPGNAYLATGFIQVRLATMVWLATTP